MPTDIRDGLQADARKHGWQVQPTTAHPGWQASRTRDGRKVEVFYEADGTLIEGRMWSGSSKARTLYTAEDIRTALGWEG